MRKFLNAYYRELINSKRPLILAGNGARGSVGLLKKVAERYNIPIVTSLLGLDLLSYDYSLRVGMIGTYGNRWANYALGDCDLLLVLGSRLDVRQTGSVDYLKHRKIFHVDIENTVPWAMGLKAPIHEFLIELLTLDSHKANWMDDINIDRKRFPDTAELDCRGINPNKFMHFLSSKNPAAYTVDVGSNQMWAAQSLELYGQRFIASGGMGAMGFAIPAAIGAAIAIEQPIVCIVGDGGMQINIQELQTIKRYDLPIKIVVMNNHCLGMIRQFQDAYFKGRYKATLDNYDAPDFVKIAEAYGIRAATTSSFDLKGMWDDDKAFLLNVEIDPYTNIAPKVMWGDPINVVR